MFGLETTCVRCVITVVSLNISCIGYDDLFVGDAVLAEAGALRDQLMTILTQLLAGDHIAAEYLLCHLVSSV